MLIGASAGMASIGLDHLHQVSYSVPYALNCPISLVLLENLGQHLEFQFEFPTFPLPVGEAQSVYWSVNTDGHSIQGSFGAVIFKTLP